MIRGFSIKNIIIGLLGGALIASYTALDSISVSGMIVLSILYGCAIFGVIETIEEKLNK